MATYDELRNILDNYVASSKTHMESIKRLPDGNFYFPYDPPVLDIARVRALLGKSEEKPIDIMAETRRMLG